MEIENGWNGKWNCGLCMLARTRCWNVMWNEKRCFRDHQDCCVSSRCKKLETLKCWADGKYFRCPFVDVIKGFLKYFIASHSDRMLFLCSVLRPDSISEIKPFSARHKCIFTIFYAALAPKMFVLINKHFWVYRLRYKQNKKYSTHYRSRGG